MPIHDWTLVDAGLFHAFHHQWITALSNVLNQGTLPSEYFALPEQKTGGFGPDVLTLKLNSVATVDELRGGVALAEAPPRTTIVTSVDEDFYARKANRIAVHHVHGEVVAIVEIVSPGNKASKAATGAFVRKAVDLIQHGIHFLVIDVFPPGPRDPSGLHKLIWDEFREEPFSLPAGKSRLLASYKAEHPWTAFIEPIAVGDELPKMPLFLTPDIYVPVPLESSYQTAWSNFPIPMQKLLA